MSREYRKSRLRSFPTVILGDQHFGQRKKDATCYTLFLLIKADQRKHFPDINFNKLSVQITILEKPKQLISTDS